MVLPVPAPAAINSGGTSPSSAPMPKVDALATSRDTATNPAVLTAFGLALIGSFGPPAYPGIPGYAPNLTERAARPR